MPCFDCKCFREGVDNFGNRIGGGRGYCVIWDEVYYRSHECRKYAPVYYYKQDNFKLHKPVATKKSVVHNNEGVNKDVHISEAAAVSDKVGCLAVLVFIVLLVVFVGGIVSGVKNSSDKNKENLTSTSTITEKITEEQLDLSAYEGSPDVNGKISLVKEYDSWVLEVKTKVTNSSTKNIELLKIYIVTCDYQKTPLESDSYAKTISIENLKSGKTQNGEYIAGTTTYGEKEFIAYVGYIKYEDGSEWGKETLDHKCIVTRNARIDLSFKEVEEFDYKK